MDYSQYIHPKRRSVPTPKDLVDQNGKAVFGTFDKEFQTMNLVNTKNATHLPDSMNRLKLTLWQASEIHFKEGVLLAVVCDMGIFGKTLNVFWDKRNNKVYTFDNNLKSSDTKIAENLLGGKISEAKTDVSHVKYTNLLDRGTARIQGNHSHQDDSISYDLKLTRISKPSVVSIPFDKNRPLYSQKDFFKVKGTITLNGETFESDETSTAIIDDHRGFYPRKTHYDWVTTLGYNEHDGKMIPFAFNLTRNQSIDQEQFNENLIWFEGKTSLLPPVTFTREPESKDFQGESLWKIRDEHDMVHVDFHVSGMSPMIMHAGVVNIDYYIAFGMLEGYLRDEEGNKYILDGMIGMGEDKTLLL